MGLRGTRGYDPRAVFFSLWGRGMRSFFVENFLTSGGPFLVNGACVPEAAGVGWVGLGGAWQFWGASDKIFGHGRMPEWTNGADCKSVYRGFESHSGLFGKMGFRGLSVNIFSVSDSQHEDDNLALVDFVDYAIIGDTDSPGVDAGEFFAAEGRGSCSSAVIAATSRVAMASGRRLISRSADGLTMTR